jgi:hypothetical protein
MAKRSPLSPSLLFPVCIDPVTNIGWAILERDFGRFAPPQKANDFAIDQSQILQVQYDSRTLPLRRDHGLQLRKVFDAYSTDKREKNCSVFAPNDPEHDWVRAK